MFEFQLRFASNIQDIYNEEREEQCNCRWSYSFNYSKRKRYISCLRFCFSCCVCVVNCQSMLLITLLIAKQCNCLGNKKTRRFLISSFSRQEFFLLCSKYWDVKVDWALTFTCRNEMLRKIWSDPKAEVTFVFGITKSWLMCEQWVYEILFGLGVAERVSCNNVLKPKKWLEDLKLIK